VTSNRREFLMMLMAGAMNGRSHPARLSSRPNAQPRGGKLGQQRFSWGVLYVPRTIDLRRPAPLLVALHGAGGRGQRIAEVFAKHAERMKMIVLAPDSNGGTWDQIESELGPDVEEIDAALMQVFTSYAVDARRLAVGGFSDGASYALTLGLANGDLFTHVLAFSPGYVDDATRVGKPRIFVSHGNADRILPIDRCSRLIVPRLQRRKYEVRYREFDGGHTVPPAILDEAMEWLGA
jgi:phospholipase/carboxylesterase